MNPTCDYEKHPSPCACCDWRLRVELPDLRARLQAVEGENERMRALLVRVWRQSEVNPGSKLYEDMERFFAAQPTEDK